MQKNNSFSLSVVRSLSIFILGMNLAGCDGHNFDDLNQYIASVKARPIPPIKPLPEFKPVEPYLFNPKENLRDPFKLVEKIRDPSVDESEEPDNGIRPDTSRPPEPLEAFALNVLKMVGTVRIDGELWGLVKIDSNTVYRVKVGNHLGKNYGKIISISKNKIEFVEIVPSTPGRYVEQPGSLVMIE